MKKFYTYAYLRKDGSPYYIGKGCGRRAYSKNHNVSLPPKDRIVLLKQHLTEEEALKHEIYMISVFGRKDLRTGILHNRTDGGDNPPKNWGKCWNKGISLSEETKQKISKSLKGRKHSEETKTKIGEANRKRVVSDETKQKMSQSLKGKTKGRKHSEEHKRKVSESKKGKPRDEETREKISKSLTKLTPEERRENYRKYQREYKQKQKQKENQIGS